MFRWKIFPQPTTQITWLPKNQIQFVKRCEFHTVTSEMCLLSLSLWVKLSPK